MGKWWVWGSCD